MAHNDVGDTGLKRALNLMGPYRYLLPPTTYFKTKLHNIRLVPLDDGLVT